MSSLDDASLNENLRLADLAVKLLARLKAEHGYLNVQSLCQYRGPELQEYNNDEIKQAFKDLDNKGMAQLHGNSSYEITKRGSEALPSDLIHEQLKQYCAEIRPNVEGRRLWRITILFSLMLTLTGYYAYSASASWRLAWVSPLALLLSISSLVIVCYSAVFKIPKFRISRERIIALKFFDAYSTYKNVIVGVDKEKNLAKTKTALRSIGGGLETSEQEPTRWAVLNSERKKISDIGKGIRNGLIQAIDAVKTQSGAEKMGMVLISLARYFIDPSSENMSKAVQLIPPPRAGPASRIEHHYTREIFGNLIVIYAIIVCLIIAGYVQLAQTAGWKLLGEAADYFGLVAASLTAYVPANALAQRIRGQK